MIYNRALPISGLGIRAVVSCVALHGELAGTAGQNHAAVAVVDGGPPIPLMYACVRNL